MNKTPSEPLVPEATESKSTNCRMIAISPDYGHRQRLYSVFNQADCTDVNRSSVSPSYRSISRYSLSNKMRRNLHPTIPFIVRWLTINVFWPIDRKICRFPPSNEPRPRFHGPLGNHHSCSSLSTPPASPINTSSERPLKNLFQFSKVSYYKCTSFSFRGCDLEELT